jgi:predicted HD superfamily hydrolase involved in NAD metabolism
LPEHPYLPFLQSVLTPARLQHSIGVMQVMAELAPVYGLDPQKALTAGLLHDAGKDLPQEQIEALIKQGNIQINHPSETNYVLYLHGPVGATLVQHALGIEDAEILGAICTHSFYGDGPYFDSTLTWCLRFADIMEPNRDWAHEPILFDCAAGLQRYAYSGQMAAGKYLQADSLIRWFEAKGFPVHPNLHKIKNEYKKEGKDGCQNLE